MKMGNSFLSLLFVVIGFAAFSKSQLVEWNNTNFHNLIFNRKFNLSRYHVYPFDLLKKHDFEKLFENLQNETAAENDDDDVNATSMLDKIVSVCGKLPKMLPKSLDEKCVHDLDFIACSLFDFIRSLRSLVEGSCDELLSEHAITECKRNLTNSVNANIWALRMLDSFGKLTAGVNMGNHQYLGRYQDCRRIYVQRDDRPFQAAYCRLTFQLPLPETAAVLSEQCLKIPLLNAVDELDVLSNRTVKTCDPKRNFARMKLGICLPSSCNTRNMTGLFRFGLQNFTTKNFCNVTVVCETRHFNFSIDIKFIATVLVISILWLLLLLGTIYDVFFYQVAVNKRISEHNYKFVREIDAQNLDSSYRSNGNQKQNAYYDYSRQTKDEYFEELDWYFKIILAFSVYTNGSNILNIIDKPHELRCINAIKTLSTAWMISILAHLYIIGYIDNTKVVPSFIRRFCFQMINNGSFVADTFLLISGFLMSYWFMKRDHIHSIKSPCLWLKFYFRRLLRIFPPYLALIIMMLTIWKYFPRGPMWTSYFFASNSPLACTKSFWTNFLFLNNFLRVDSACMPTTQHLAIDMQVYLFAPFLFVLYMKFTKIGFIVCSMLLGLSALSQTLLVVLAKLPPSLIATVDVYSLDQPMTEYYNRIFIKPYMRWNAFLVGMMLGHLIVRINQGKVISIGKKITVLLWTIAISLCTCVVYGLTNYARGLYMPTAIVAIYTCLSRLVWSLAVGAIIFLCVTNRGGIIQWIFSWPIWAPLSRLTYSVFLLCPFVIAYTYTSSQASLHLTTYNMMYFTLGIILINYMVAVIFHLTFEAPWLALRNMFCFKSFVECPVEVVGFLPPRMDRNEKFENPSGRIIEESRLLPAAVIVDRGNVEMSMMKTKL